MTFGKGLALALGFVAAVALGIMIGPYVTERESVAKVMRAADVDQPQAGKSRTRAARESRTTRPSRSAEADETSAMSAVSTSAPELHKHLKPLFNRGTNMEIAAEGFRDAEQFATVAHASKNTGIPFVVLKHRVLNEGKSLAAAIEQSKPEMNAASEAKRARAEARTNLAEFRADAEEAAPTATSGEDAPSTTGG